MKNVEKYEKKLCHRKYIWTWFNLDAIGMELMHEWSVYNNKLKIINFFPKFSKSKIFINCQKSQKIISFTNKKKQLK